jgi:transposase InsO family protein
MVTTGGALELLAADDLNAVLAHQTTNAALANAEPFRQCLGASFVRHWSEDNGERGDEELLLVAQDRADRQKDLPNGDSARADVLNFIERFYDTVRRHSTIGYLSPVEFEKKAGSA